MDKLDNAILIFGLPRSGTTWIGKIFDSHPNTLYLHEPDTTYQINELSLVLNRGATKTHDAGKEDIINMLKTAITNRPSRIFCKTPLFSKNYMSRPQQLMSKSLIWTNKLSERLIGKSVPLFDTFSLLKSRRDRVVWKSIESVGRIAKIKNSLPGCHAILIARHPAGYISSVLRGEKSHRFTDNKPSADDLHLMGILLNADSSKKFGLTLEKINKMGAIERLSWRWLMFYENALDNLDADFTLVAYEAICARPLEQIKLLFNRTGLSLTKQTEIFIHDSTTSHSNSYYSVTKNPLDSAYKWRHELSESNIKIIEDVLIQNSELHGIFNF